MTTRLAYRCKMCGLIFEKTSEEAFLNMSDVMRVLHDQITVRERVHSCGDLGNKLGIGELIGATWENFP